MSLCLLGKMKENCTDLRFQFDKRPELIFLVLQFEHICFPEKLILRETIFSGTLGCDQAGNVPLPGD